MIRTELPRAGLVAKYMFLAAFVFSTAFSTLLATAVAAEPSHYLPIAPPAVSARAAFVLDVTSGTELFAQNPDEPLAPASLTKIVSALVIIDEVDLEERIEILPEDLVSPEESQVGLVAGDVLTARDLLYGVLIPSGNDATLALARHIGEARLGETAAPDAAVAEFVSLMNAKAQELGANASHFVNPTGIDSDGHVMSARDVATLAAVAIKNPLISDIVATSSVVLASETLPDGYSVTTTNLLLLEGVAHGIKTGSTPKAGGCLATAFTVGPNEVIAVVLGSEVTESADGLLDYSSRFADVRSLIAATSSDYVWIDPAAPDAVAGLLEELLVWDVRFAEDVLLPVPEALASDVRYRLVLDPPAAPEELAGEVQFFVGDRLLSERPALQTN